MAVRVHGDGLVEVRRGRLTGALRCGTAARPRHRSIPEPGSGDAIGVRVNACSSALFPRVYRRLLLGPEAEATRRSATPDRPLDLTLTGQSDVGGALRLVEHEVGADLDALPCRGVMLVRQSKGAVRREQGAAIV